MALLKESMVRMAERKGGLVYLRERQKEWERERKSECVFVRERERDLVPVVGGSDR